MASYIDKLRSLYIKHDSIAAAGDDVVADLRKEINNLELSILREYVIPKIAKLLFKEISELRCNIDCNLQYINGKIEYSFCTENSPVVRDAVSKENLVLDSFICDSTFNPEILNKLSSSINRLSDLTLEIESCKAEALKYISQIQKSTPFVENMIFPITDDDHSIEEPEGRILFCRSQNSNAKGRLRPERNIIILKGSILRSEITPTYGPKEFREDILARYCSLTDNGYIVLSDLPPMSVSRASGLCLGRSSNGNMDWKDEHGVSLAFLK